MKRIIFSMLAFALSVFGTATFAHAQSFNNDPRDMATVLVAKGSCSSGTVDGCWQPSVTASAGDIIGVHLYYHNTGTTTANNVAVGMNPRTSGQSTTHTMRGGILVNGSIAKTGSATVNLTSSQTLTFIDAKWFPNQSLSGQSVDGTALFDNYGMSVGNLAPGWGSQGTVVARYRVGSTVVTPTTYQCNDTVDNDGDGRVDMSDPGCSSSTDNDEYDQVVAQCYISQFYASPTNVTSGGYTTLYWNTDGCDYLTIDGVSYPVDGSGSFGPIYANRSYDLRAWRSGSIASRSVYVNVNQVNPTYQCNDGYDNDSDGKVDYPSDPGCSSSYDNDEYNQVITVTQPQAITTVATITSSTTARLNGIAVPNYSGTSSAWFDWGTTGSVNNRTNAQSVTGSGSNYFSDSISGLTPGAVYYYRAVVQNANGIAYGEIVRFQTQKTPVITEPKVITKVVTRTVKDTVTAKSTPSLLELRVENVYDRMCVNGDMEYTVTYRNISSQTLQDTVLRVIHPKELTFINASRGNYEVVDRALTIPLGELSPGESGTVMVRARVNNEAVRGNVAVLTAQVVYTNMVTRAQEDAIAYSLITVSDECPNQNVLGASVFGLGSFFPSTLLGWLILILIILALIVLGRQLSKKKVE